MYGRAFTLGLLLVTAAFAGCIGSDGDGVEPADVDGEDADVDDEQLPQQNVTSWQNATVEGTVTGANVGGNALTAHDQSENTVVEFTAEPGVQQVFLNVTTDGSEIMLSINAPDCEPGDTQAGCESLSTSGGEASYLNETPQEGTWQITVFPDEPALVDATFQIDILQAVELPG